MRYRLEIKEEARQEFRALPKEQRHNVGRRLDALQVDLSGDVKKLSAKPRDSRLIVQPMRSNAAEKTKQKETKITKGVLTNSNFCFLRYLL